MFTRQVHLSVGIIPILLFAVGHCDHSGYWSTLPHNISAYLNCSLTISVVFNSTNDNYNCSYESDYNYYIYQDNKGIHIKHKDIHPISDYVCNITGTISVTKSHHDVHFRAIPLRDEHSHIYHPSIDVFATDSLSGPILSLNKSCNCSGELLQWTAPTVLPNYKIFNYNLFVKETNITYHTFDTWIFTPYSDLELHRHYEILISASYCAGQGNETSVSIVTSIAPQLETALKYTFSVINNTTASVSFQAKVSDVQCTVSFPTSVSIDISCGDHMIHSRKMDVSVNVDGTILLEDIKVPVDHSYNASLYWNNLSDQPNASTIVFNTYQLQSCDISSTHDNIIYKCSYADQTVLWGCGVEVINIMNGDTNTSNTTSDNGVINGLCDGMYNVTCYGIPNSTSSDRIIYNSSKYNSMISVTGSDCEVSSSSVQNHPFFTPTIVPVTPKDNKGNILIIILPIIFICLLLLVIVGITILVVWRLKRKNGRYELATDKELEEVKQTQGISASQHLKPSSDSLDSIRDVIPLFPDPDETDNSTANDQLYASNQNNDEHVANNGVNVPQQIIDGTKDSTPNNGVDASKQCNDKPVNSTTNNGVDGSKQNNDKLIDSTTSNGLDASKQNNDKPVNSTVSSGLDALKQNNDEPVDSTTNNVLDVSKENYGISHIEPSLGNDPDTTTIITSSTSPKKHTKAEQETGGTQDNSMKVTPSPITEDKKQEENLEVKRIEQISNQMENKGDVPKDDSKDDMNRVRHQKPVLETITDIMSRRGSAISYITSKVPSAFGSSRRESVKTDKRDISETERYLMDPSTITSSQETESLPLEIYKPPQESQPSKTDIVVPEAPKRKLSVVSGGTTKYKPALSDSETMKLLQDVSSTSELKSEQYGERHSPPPEGNPTLDKGSIVLQNKTANLDATVTGMIKQHSMNEERNEPHESQQDTQTTDQPTIIAMQEENSDTTNSNLNINKNI